MEYVPLRIGELTAEVPIIQGGMGVGISLSGLAGAVAKAGGVGIISAAQIGFRDENFDADPIGCNLKAIGTEYAKAKELSEGHGIVGYNIMVAMQHYEDYVRAAVDAGVELIISGAGLPTELPEYVAGSKTKIAPIVSTNKSVKVILRFWAKRHHRTADMVVIEGPQAGGHLGFSKEQLDLYGKDAYVEEIKAIQATVREYEEQFGVKIPVVVAGGINDAAQMKEVMDLGVDGVQVASRFVTTVECDASEEYKQKYIEAKEEDIMIVKSPVGMPGRAIKNPFMDRVMSGEKVTPSKCHTCLHKCNPAEIPYCITDALINAAIGNVDEALLFCGANAYKQNKMETVQEVIDSFVS